MNKITILCPSPLIKDQSIQSIANDYIKRHNAVIEIIDLNVKIKSNDSDVLVKQKQGEAILNKIDRLSSSCALMAMDERGKLLDSRQFSTKLSDYTIQGYSDLCIIIGGAYGLSSDVLNRVDFKLSFGPMVWPHRLVAIMVLEQLYRAQQINAGHPYHKD